MGTKLAKDGKTYIQINDRFVNADDVADYVSADQARMLPEDREIMTVAIKADRDTRMGIITDVKQALRKAKATRVTYSADKRKE